MKPEIRLNDPSLFGNDAAEDEREDVFASYVVEREELHPFVDAARAIAITRAYKGEGKSALLRLAKSRVAAADDGALIVLGTAGDIAPATWTDDFAAAVRIWKDALLKQVACEMGARIGIAISDDAMALVEEAQKTGVKKRNIVSAMLRRLPGMSIGIGGATVTVDSASLPGVRADAVPLIRRWAKEKPPIWVLIDDVDQNFQDTPQQKTKVASFFVACRELTNAIPQIRVRAAVRPNVWTTIKMEFEALSHVEQYIRDLHWDEKAVLAMLARRIEGYLARTGQTSTVAHLSRESLERNVRLMELAFEPIFKWGGRDRPPIVVLYTLSKQRPRWIIELCKSAAANAFARGRPKIGLDDVLSDLEGFGGRRVQDTISEFRAQCPQVGELLSAFVKEPEQMTTDLLLSTINRKIISHLNPRIIGIPGRPGPRDIAAFLFEIGFIFAREELGGGAYRHLTYTDKPHLLRSRAATDEGLTWEVHPVFRQILEMRDAAGHERAPTTKGHAPRR